MTAFFFNGLIFLYDILGKNLGVAIIVFTVIIKFLLAWPSASFIRSQRKIQALQPKLNALKAKHKNDREGLAKATMELYKTSRVNPFSSCLPSLIQIPILFVLYRVFLSSLNPDPTTGLLQAKQLQELYEPLRTTYATTPIDTHFLFGFNLARHGIAFGSVLLGVVAGLLQFWQTKMLSVKQPPRVPGAQDESLAAATTKQMTYIFPVLTVVLVVQFPAGLGLYWVASTAFSIVQQYLILRRLPSIGGSNDASQSA